MPALAGRNSSRDYKDTRVTIGVQTLSLNDVTFICNRNIKPVMETATDPDTINEAFIYNYTFIVFKSLFVC